MSGSPGTQLRAVDGVVVEAIPLGEDARHVALVLGVVPRQHVGGVLDAGLAAERLDDLLGLIQEVVGVEDGDADLALGRGLSGPGGADELLVPQEVEQPHELRVPRLVGHVVREAGDLALRRHAAPVV